VGTGETTGRGSKLLGEILEAEPNPEPRPSQYHEAHHIVAENDERAAEARLILKRANIPIYSKNNGVWLPRTSRGVTSERGIIAGAFSSHDDIHTDLYYQELTERLQIAEDLGDVEGELQRIKSELKD
jgi:hypothetical protein